MRELGGIHAHLQSLGAEIEIQPSGIADQAAKNGGVIAYQLIQIQHQRLQGLATAEDKQLLGEGRSAAAGGVNGGDFFPAERLAGELGREDFAIAVDDGQEIVEIVRDSAGEPADRIKVLGVDQSLLQSAFLGDVTVGRDDVAGASGGIAEEVEAPCGEDQTSVGAA